MIAASAEHFAETEPDNLEYQSDLALSNTIVAEVLEAQGKLTEALASYNAALAIRNRLNTIDHENRQWQRGLIWLHL